MKLGEMAELLRDFTSFLEKHGGKAGVGDLRRVADCFATYPDDTVASFCGLVLKAKETKAATPKRTGKAIVDVESLKAKILHYLDHRSAYDYAQLELLGAEVGTLCVPQLKAFGKEVGCHLGEKSKAANIQRFKNWLKTQKMMDDHAASVSATASPNWARPQPAVVAAAS